jgi:hypothetical protein
VWVEKGAGERGGGSDVGERGVRRGETGDCKVRPGGGK